MSDDYPIEVPISVLWGDMDALGHVNNARYFVWFEAARIATFAAIGVKVDEPSEVGPIVATTSCDYLKPLRYPAELVAGCRISKVGRTSLVMEYAIWPAGEPAAVAARGSGVVVMVNYHSGAKVRVPDSVRERIAAL